ncbi:hypothetical protein, conserved [Babesia ovata]|uniref:C3H1-type domain-containing protein n=1 Tax=Babesia ovata TaxID=189622 RepID=A0A2H6KK01_9APIC|nr:uncharacterized protein BOVATA_048020 [Babesia ovata]GBE63309.1 hypothetical protein, conserved [Babesia ovata]
MPSPPTSAVRSLFSASHAADLQALRALVDQQLREVQNIIARDAVTGVKGMLKWMKGTGEYSLGEIQKIVPTPTQPTLTAKDHSGKFKDLSTRFEKYADKVLVYIEGQVKTPNKDPSQDPESNPQSDNVHDIQGKLDYLLNYLKRNTSGNLSRPYNFDHTSNELLDKLKKSISALSPSNFHGFHNPLLLDALRRGMTQFTEQLGHAYVNKYSGKTFGPLTKKEKVADPSKQKSDAATTTEIDVLSTEGRNCAKVCLTILEEFYADFNTLKAHCYTKGGWTQLQINTYEKNSLGDFFHKRGYEVNSEKGKQAGELQDKDTKKGTHISSDLLIKKITDGSTFPIIQAWRKTKYPTVTNSTEISLFDFVDFIRELLRKYYQVCQLEHHSSTKAPSNIYQMLCWLSGFYFNPMYEKVKEQFNGLFDKDIKQLAVVVPDREKHTKTENLKASDLHTPLQQVCLRSQLTLTAILGHGHPDGRYACDFRTNIDNLLYPYAPSQCLDMLVDILKRVCQQTYFLYLQCNNSRIRGGWADCHYGRYVGGSSWDCNERQCPNEQCNLRPNQRADQSANQGTNQKCNQHPKCGVKSPLQSFLEDGLPGFLPHTFTTPGCKLTCSLGNHFGKPCLTPMGFADIGIVASHTQKGAYLLGELKHFCGPDSKLNKLCSYLNCLLRVAPQTLGDMLAFYHRLLRFWGDTKKTSVLKSVAFDEAVRKANFGNKETKLDVTFIHQYDSHSSNTHKNGDLFSLIICNKNENPAVPCGPYLQPLSLECCDTFSGKHSGNYLSWVVYITETFYDLLKKLYEDCCGKCNKPGTRCYDKCCDSQCKINFSYGTGNTPKQLKDVNHEDGCTSIVKCKNIHPTLYAYGFTFKSPHGLSGEKRKEMKRTCQDFCTALEKVVKDGSVLYDLVHKHIPQFLFDIREKFIWTLVALWSLSLLYLLHIAVVRLDVLRIRSHLKSPSSHRIAAQSLLAAARSLNEQIDSLKNSDKSTDNSQNDSKIADLKSQLKDHVAKYHSLSESDRTAQLKDIRSRMVSLADLSGKLGQFIGNSDAVTKAINDGIDAIIDSNEDFKSLKKSSSSTAHPPAAVPAELINDGELSKKIKHYEDKIASLSAEIDELKTQKTSVPDELNKSHESHQSKLQSLQRLSKLNESFKSLSNISDDNCKNLLNNLCSGLEKFLGYQETSKGYSGTGIVYSDVDRLADGVMSFLHGVLNEVYTNNNLQKYKDPLTTPLAKITDALYNRMHFDSSIVEVGKGIKQWVSGVDERNAAITKPLENLQLQISDHIKTNMDGIYITEQLDNWRGFSSLHIQEVEKAEKALKEVDKNLQDKLSPSIKLMRDVTQNFWNTVNDDSVISSVKELNEKFTQQRSGVSEHIGRGIDRVEKTLNEKYEQINKNINSLKKDKEKHIGDISRAVKLAQQLAERLVGEKDSTFDKDYRDQVVQRFTELRGEIEEFTKESSHLLTNFATAQNKVRGLEEDVREGLTQLKNTIGNLKIETIAADVLRELQEAKEKLVKVTGSQAGSNGDAKNLENLFGAKIQQPLHGFVTGVKEKIGSLCESVGEERTKSMRAFLEKIREHAENIGRIDSNSHQSDTALAAVTEYVGWAGDGFDKKVEQWVHQTVMNADLAGTIYHYVNGAIGNPYLKKISDATKKGVQKIIDIVKQSGTKPSVKSNDVKSTLNGVRSFLDGVKNHVNSSKASEIVQAIDQELTTSGFSSSGKNGDLTKPITAILTSISAKARKDSASIEAFTQSPQADFVNGVLGKTLNLVGQIDIACNADVDGKLELLSNTVEKLNKTFSDGVKNGLQQAVDKFNSAAEDGIKDAADKAVTDALAKFQMKKDGHIDVAAMMTQFEESRKSLDGAVQKIQEQLTELQQLPATVTSKSALAKQTMENLKAKIQEILRKITAIETPITAANAALESAIKAVEAALQDAKRETGIAMTALKSSIQKRVTQALNDLEGGVEKMFDAQKKAELKYILNSVSEQFSSIQDSIERDKESGLKGLMRKMSSQFANLTNSGKQLDSYANKVKSFYDKFFGKFKSQSDVSPHSTTIQPVTSALSSLLTAMHSKQHFHQEVSDKIDALKRELHNFTPKEFADASPLLNVIKRGVTRLHEELRKQYVSRYSGAAEGFEWTKNVDDAKAQETVPSEKAMKCAKVFMTCVQMLLDNLSELKDNCTNGGSWSSKHLYLYEDSGNGSLGKENPLGAFFRNCGYRVSSALNRHNGELRNTTACRGGRVHEILAASLQDTFNNSHLNACIKDKHYKGQQAKTQFNVKDLLDCLNEHLHDYYTVCHYSTLQSKTYPSSVFDMLKWLCGLTHNPVYADLSVNGFDKLLEQYQEKDEENDEDNVIVVDDAAGSESGRIPVKHADDDKLEAYPHPIAVSNLSDALQDVCHYSYDVLTGVLGFGYGEGVYACDYNINQGGLSYPTNMDTLLCMICDVINRLYRQLHFLFQQCRYDSTLSGWADCWYGNGVGGSAWKCNSMQCPGQDANQIAKQNTNQTHKQTCNQKCEQRVMCGVKSPLQSFLEDGLQGFLPHGLKSERGKLECSLKSHAGVPCITPMGFAGIAGVASHRQTGQFLMEVLADFCGNQKSPLTKICSLFNCVLPSPPKSLSDMFGFYYSLLGGWDDKRKSNEKLKQHRETAFTKAVSGVDFDNPDTTLDITDMFKSSDHGIPKPADQTSSHLTGDLYALVNCTRDKSHTPSHPCGPYLRPLCSDICTMFSEKHANKYVSWIVFLTESFYDLLKRLLEDCERTCGAEATRCKIGKCSEGCKTKELPYGKDSKHDKSCKSIVECNYIRPTFYKYGFIHESVSSLSGVSGEEGKRTCADFCAILKIVTGEKKTLHKIVFDKITGFFPLVALAPVPAAHRRRPPRRPEDTLPPEIALKPPHRRTVPPRHRTQDARGRALKDIDERQKTLDGLKQNLEAFIGKENDNPAKNLLQNLTDGLEKFLGFNPASKGYSGEGIVYSDLDRLCDGVMSFLHGVLKDVRDHKNLEPYKEKLTQAVNLLESKRYDGKTGLRTVIDHVKEGIAGWLGDVENKSEAVKKPLESLRESLGNHLLLNLEADPITDQLDNWQGLSSLYLQEVKKSEGALENVDQNLQDKISPKMELIKRVVDNFWDSVNESNLTSSVNELDEKFIKQRRDVKSYVSTEINEVENTLKQNFDAIGRNIQKLRHEKVRHISLITSAVKLAKQFAENLLSEDKMDGFEKGYKDKITAMFTEIMNNIEKFTKVNADGSKVPLLSEFDIVKSRVDNLDEDVRAGLEELKKNIDGLDSDVYSNKNNSLVEQALSKLGMAKTALDTGTIQEITLASKLLGVKYERADFKGQFEKLRGAFPTLRKAVFGENGSPDDPENDSLAKLITKLTAAIGTSDDGNVYGLEQAVTAFNNAAIERIKEAAQNAIDEAVKKFKVEVIDDDSKIKVAEMMEMFEASRKELNAAVQKIQEELKKLKSVPETVNNKSREADTTMAELKQRITKIKEAIERISPLVEKAGSALESAIQAVEASLQEARSNANRVLQDLKMKLQGRVQQAFDDLETHVQKMFAEQKKSELKYILNSVSEQFSSIQDSIERDKVSGLKGLMRKMSSQFANLKNFPNNLQTCANRVKSFLDKFLKQLKSQSDLTSDQERITTLQDALLQVLTEMNTKKHFHREVSDKIDALKRELDSFTPKEFHEASPLLNVIKRGVADLHEQLRKQYVSRYSGLDIVWMTPQYPPTQKQEPTEDAKKCAKVFMTCVQTLLDNLSELWSNCGSKDIWQNKTISLTETGTHGNIITNPLGSFFQRCGYRVSSAPNKHTGELRNTTACRGGHINGKFNEQINSKDYLIKDEDLKKEKRSNKDEETDDQTSPKQHGILKQLFDHLHYYYTVCHYSTLQSKTYPSSVCDMLKWLCGLTHNPVYADLSVNGFDKLLEQYQEKDENDEDNVIVVDDAAGSESGRIPVKHADDDKLEAYPHPIAVSNLSDALQDVCHYSYDVLTGVLGFGYGEGVYACDYNINQGGLSYPTNMDTLLCMICDVINRLYRQLHFLFQQCRYDSTLSGWQDCWYGNGVGGSAWKCNSMQCPGQDANQIAKQNTNQTHKQTCNQKCEQRVMCGVKSPLQSFLEDGLQGFLPHSLKSERGKLECSLKSHAGVPCITPMGFAGIAGLASHRRTGQFLMEVLADFCGNQKSPLTKICSLFNCVLPSPPKSLSDMFGFYYSLLCGWEDSSKRYENRKQHRETAFNNAVSAADFDNPDTKLDITDMFKSSNHILPKPADQTSTHLTGDLYALVNCADAKSHTPSHPCGPYLRPLCGDICTMFSEKHANKYVSWIVFLTESFYDLLKKLLEDCEKTCGAEATRCKIGKCSEGCKTKELPYGKDSKHDKSCKSIVQCNYIRPTFYKYGFIHDSVSSLSGVAGEEGKRTCADFCAILKIVTEEKKTLHKIVFDKITGFLWDIRYKFFYTLVSLWSLTLLYLLHIAVVRLDVLRIRSHLRSPSSHRIAAQSLLAAARVKALANVKYFSP